MGHEQFTRYVIVLNKVENRETPKEVVAQHIEHLEKLDRDGKLVLCGPFTDYPSGMVIIQAKDKAEATAIAEADPFVRAGVRSFDVRTWLLACRENGYLA